MVFVPELVGDQGSAKSLSFVFRMAKDKCLFSSREPIDYLWNLVIEMVPKLKLVFAEESASCDMLC